jgi:hypothetical protein
VVEHNVINYRTLTILTEEAPAIEELNFIITDVLSIDTPQINISPTLNNKSFNGEWEIKINAHTTIIIKLFKGESSCVDYLVYEGYVDDNTNAGNAL